MLSHIEFQNIKALADVQVDLEPLTVLVGPNGCGKSTLLDQVELLCAASRVEPGDERHTRGGWIRALLETQRSPRTHGATGAQRWVGVAGDTRLELTIPPGPRHTRERLGLSITAGTEQHTVNPLEDPTPERRLAVEELRRARFGWRVLRLTLRADAIRKPSPVAVPVDTLDASGLGLPSLLAHIKLNDTTRLEAIEQDLRTVVPHFERLRFIVQGGGSYQLELELRGAGVVPAEHVSDGTLLALALVTAAHWQPLPPILLLDDLDQGLHLAGQFQVIQALRRMMAQRPGLQVLATTHSPYLLDALQVEEVRVMGLSPGGHARVRALAEHPDAAQLRRGLQTGELWATLGEDWVREEG